VDVPMIKESPVNIECTVKDIIELGSHDMFIAQIEAVSVDESLLTRKGGCAWRKRILYAIPMENTGLWKRHWDILDIR